MAFASSSPSKTFLLKILGGPYGTFESFLLFTEAKSHLWKTGGDVEWGINETTLRVFYESHDIALKCDGTLSAMRLEIVFCKKGYIKIVEGHFFNEDGDFLKFRDSFISATSVDPYPFQNL